MGKHRVEDLHPEDVENLIVVRAQLKAMAEHNRGKGVTLTDMANRVGRSHWFLNVLWSGRTWPGYWKFSTFHDLCRAVGGIPTVRAEYNQWGSMKVMADHDPKFLGAAIQQLLENARDASEMSVSDVANAAGVAKSAPWRAENSDDPRLSTLMRYARVYDNTLRFGVVL